MLRVALFFVTAVGAILTVSALAGGDRAPLAWTAPLTAVAGLLLWRDLRDPARGRDGGVFATVTFTLEPGPGLSPGPGTSATILTHLGSWATALDRPPERGDLALHGVPRRGWVWLDAQGLPRRLRIDGGSGWKSWTVSAAVPFAAGGGP